VCSAVARLHRVLSPKVLVAVSCAMCCACGRVGFDARAERDARGVDAADTPRLVQETVDSKDAVTTLSVTLPAAPKIGNMLIFVGGSNIAPLATISGGSTAWTRAIKSSVNPNIEIWFGVADGSSAITIDASVPTGMTTSVSEWSGLLTSDPLDTAVAMAGTSNPASTGMLTTTNANDLLISGVADFLPTAIGDPTTSAWTKLNTFTSNSVQTVWYQTTTAIGTYDATLASASNRWDAAIAAFRLSP
jgi:hypothetical protein